MDRVSGITKRFSISSLIVFALYSRLHLLRSFLAFLSWLLCLLGRIIVSPACADGLHVEALIQQSACHLDVLSMIGHDDDVVYEQLAELVVRHCCKQGAEGRTGFDDGSSKV